MSRVSHTETDVVLYCFGCGDVDYTYSDFGEQLEVARDHNDVCDGSVMIEALLPEDIGAENWIDPRYDSEATWPSRTEQIWTVRQ